MIKVSYLSLEPNVEGHASFTHVQEIIQNLIKLGAAVTLFSPNYAGGRLPGVVNRIWAILTTLHGLMVAARPNLVYMRWHFAAWPVSFWCRLRKIPCIIEVNGPEQDLFIAWPLTRYLAPLFHWLMRSQLRYAKAIVVMTPGLDDLCRKIVGPNKRIDLIPNGVNTDLFRPDSPISPELADRLPQKFFIFFGTMAPWQGITRLVEAVQLEDWPDIPILFVGNGVEASRLQAIASKRPDRVIHIPRIPYKELAGVIARSMGSFVCTENIQRRASTGLAPLKLFESIAVGVPLVITDLPFQADIVREADCGIVVPQYDTLAIVKAACRLIDDSTEYERLVRNAKGSTKNHSWESRARDTYRLMLDVASASR